MVTTVMKIYIALQFVVITVMSGLVGYLGFMTADLREWQQKEVQRQEQFEAARRRQVIQEADLLVKQKANIELVEKITEKLQKAVTE